jgi:D-alanyl-D-alanine carboxypeptidase
MFKTRGNLFYLLLTLIILISLIFVKINDLRSKSDADFTASGSQSVLGESTQEKAPPISITATISAQKWVPTNTITDKGNDLLVLVNKKIGLSPNYEPADLVFVSGTLRLRKEAANAYSNMVSSAAKKGVVLAISSAYRSYADQQNTFNYWVSKNGWQIASTISAEPGHSQHQLGTAVDFDSLSEGFGQTSQGSWLTLNAYKFGFVLSYPAGKEAITGYTYEPWHYRYIGVENAQNLQTSGLCLEEFLQKYGVW